MQTATRSAGRTRHDCIGCSDSMIGSIWTMPLCGFAFTNELVRDIFVGFAQMRDPEWLGKTV
jgi:hypothetical protein